MIYFLKVQKERELSVKETIKIVAFSSISWGIAYLATWISKWILTDIIFNGDFSLTKTALEQFGYRSLDKELYYSAFEAIHRNLLYLRYNLIIALIFALYLILLNFAKNKTTSINIKGNFQKVLPYLLILLMPIVWYIVLKSHSYRHNFFTYRALLLVLIAIPIIGYKLTDSRKE